MLIALSQDIQTDSLSLKYLQQRLEACVGEHGTLCGATLIFRPFGLGMDGYNRKKNSYDINNLNFILSETMDNNICTYYSSLDYIPK